MTGTCIALLQLARTATCALPAALVAVLLAVHVARRAGAVPTLRYERAAVLAGEAWRLVTGHLVHADLGAPRLEPARRRASSAVPVRARIHAPRQWLVILVASTVAIGLGFLLLEPRLEWYVGFSGVLHGLHGGRALSPGCGGTRDPVTWLVTGLFVAKLGLGALGGSAAVHGGDRLSLPVIHEAHTYGAIGGALAALCGSRRPAARPASL
ncbi:MAG: rhombosortase [Chromatiales bacterium]|nr:rhombosortase [Chromatiales bacterium]